MSTARDLEMWADFMAAAVSAGHEPAHAAKVADEALNEWIKRDEANRVQQQQEQAQP